MMSIDFQHQKAPALSDGTGAGPVANRSPGLEWMRATLTLAVLAAHSSMAYLILPFPGLRWSTQDAGSPFLDILTWAIAAAGMPAFFLLSGFNSAAVCAKRGVDEFLSHRTRRLLPVLVLGIVFILPLTGYAWFLGWAAQGLMPLETLWRWGIPDELEQDLYGIGHLWFVQLLWLFCIGVWIAHQLLTWIPLRAKNRMQKLALRILGSAGMPFVFAIPGAIILAIEPRVAIGFRQAFLPQWLNLAYYAPCFVAGFWLQRNRNQLALTYWCEWRLLLASGLLAGLWPRLREHLATGSVGFERWLLAISFSTFAWLAATGTFGSFVKYLNRRLPAPVRYISNASLWVYLFHVPIVGLLQVNLQSFALAVEIKFLIVFAVGLILSLATFQVMQNTWVGRVFESQSVQQITVRLPTRDHRKQDSPLPLVSP